MHLRIITPGKTRKPFLQQAEAYYLKLLSPHHRTELVVVKTVPLKEGRNESDVIAGESAALLKAVQAPPHATVLLDVGGTSRTSPDLAGMLDDARDRGVRTMDFIIGGVIGVDDTVRARAGYRLSLGPMTFTHEMTRTLLLEQLYRAADISRGGKYHK